MTPTPETTALTTAERLEQRRITSTTEVTPHRFLYQWDSKPCFARGELVALTGKAKSGKTFFASVLMALADTEPLLGQSFKFADTILTDAVQEKIVREVEGQEGSHIYELHDGQNEIF